MVRYFFFAFLFLLPLQTVYLLREVFVGGEKWQYGVIAVYGTDVILLFSIVAFIFSCDLRKRWQSISDAGCKISDWKRSFQNPLSLISYPLSLIVLVLWAGLSILWAPDQMLAAYFFVKLLLAAGVFFLARSLSDEDTKTAIRLLIIGAVVQSLLGAWQFLAQSTFASTLLGMSAHEVAEAGTSVLKGWHQRWLRAYGTFEHPNVLGGFLATVLVLIVGYFSSVIPAPEPESRTSFSGSRIKSGMTIASAIIVLLGLILTFSRSAWLGAALGITVFSIYSYLNLVSNRVIIPRPRNYDTVFGMLMVLGVAGAVFVGVLHETVFPRFDSAAIEREGSVSERVQSLEDAKTVIGEGNMLLGTGVGNSTAEMMRLQPGRPVWSIQPAHNIPVLVFAELGLVGLVLFITFLFSVILIRQPAEKNLEIPRQPARHADASHAGGARNDSQGHGAIYIVALVVLVPALLLDHYLWTSHFGLLFFFLLLGFAARR